MALVLDQVFQINTKYDIHSNPIKMVTLTHLAQKIVDNTMYDINKILQNSSEEDKKNFLKKFIQYKQISDYFNLTSNINTKHKILQIKYFISNINDHLFHLSDNAKKTIETKLSKKIESFDTGGDIAGVMFGLLIIFAL